MPLFWYTDSKEAKGMKCGTDKAWREVEKKWRENHPYLHIINEIWDFFYYPIKRKYDFVTDIPSRVRAWFQRGNRGWADRDTWGFYDYLANVIVGGLKHLKKTKHGIPTTFCCDDKGNEIPWEEGLKKWDVALDEMIWAFEMIANDNVEMFISDKKNPDKHLLADSKFAKEYPEHHLMTKEEDERMQKGMKLFIENFQSLWD